MNRLFSITVLCLCALCGIQAQTIQNGTKWWDGSVLYTAKVDASGTVNMNGVNAHEGGFVFRLSPVQDGRYSIASNVSDPYLPVRGHVGSRVDYIRKDGMNFLAVRNDNGDCIHTLVLTSDDLKDCIFQERYAEDQPVGDIITGMLLNTTYLGHFSKDQLRLMRNEILARRGWKFQSKDLQEHFGAQSWYKPVANNNTIKLNIIEQTNVQLIKTEEMIPDDERAYGADKIGVGLFPGGLDDDGRGPDEIEDGIEGDMVIRVTNETEFLDALGDDRTVIVAANVHLNLSRVLENEDLFMKKPGRRWTGDASAIASKEPLVVSESETDGRQLALVNINNMVIRGEHNATIEVDPRYSYCLYFIRCEGCVVDNLIIGHTEGGYCSGGVIGVKGGKLNMVKDCDLYGCGTYGLDLMETTDFSLINSNVHDCTYGIMQLRSCVAVKLNKCDFFNNREYDLIEGWGNEGLVFEDCRFFANWGDASLFNLDNTFYLMGCQVYHPTERLGSMKQCEQIGKPTTFNANPLDQNIKSRGIGPK